MGEHVTPQELRESFTISPSERELLGSFCISPNKVYLGEFVIPHKGDANNMHP